MRKHSGSYLGILHWGLYISNLYLLHGSWQFRNGCRQFWAPLKVIFPMGLTRRKGERGREPSGPGGIPKSPLFERPVSLAISCVQEKQSLWIGGTITNSLSSWPLKAQLHGNILQRWSLPCSLPDFPGVTFVHYQRHVSSFSLSV